MFTIFILNVWKRYLEISVNVYRHDELWFWFILAVDNIHLEFLFWFLKQISELHRIFDAFLKVFWEITAIQNIGY